MYLSDFGRDSILMYPEYMTTGVTVKNYSTVITSKGLHMRQSSHINAMNYKFHKLAFSLHNTIPKNTINIITEQIQMSNLKGNVAQISILAMIEVSLNGKIDKQNPKQSLQRSRKTNLSISS